MQKLGNLQHLVLITADVALHVIHAIFVTASAPTPAHRPEWTTAISVPFPWILARVYDVRVAVDRAIIVACLVEIDSGCRSAAVAVVFGPAGGALVRTGSPDAQDAQGYH